MSATQMVWDGLQTKLPLNINSCNSDAILNTDICAPVVIQTTHTHTPTPTSSRRPGVHLLCVHLTSGCECFDVNPLGYVKWPIAASQIHACQ